MKTRALLLLLPVIAAAALSSCGTTADPETKPMGDTVLSPQAIHAASHGPVSFAEHVKPILETKCVMCHNRQALPGHPSLETRAEAVRTHTLGAYIVPGHPDKSLLLADVQSTHRNVSRMPAVGQRLTSAEYHILKKWIQGGAAWPAGREGVLHYVP